MLVSILAIVFVLRVVFTKPAQVEPPLRFKLRSIERSLSGCQFRIHQFGSNAAQLSGRLSGSKLVERSLSGCLVITAS